MSRSGLYTSYRQNLTHPVHFDGSTHHNVHHRTVGIHTNTATAVTHRNTPLPR